jgi:glycosyltransferase involved in cell wall biosynthesis
MNRLRLSVAMCTYNGSRYLGEQLESIAAQTRLPDELVVCDDGSQDDTMTLLWQFAKAVPFRLRIYENPSTLGPAKNFEKAIGLCEGDIIALSDQDDRWRLNKIASLVRVFQEGPGTVYAFSDGMMVDQAGRSVGQTLWEAVEFRGRVREFRGARQVEMLLRRNFISGAAMAFRAAFREVILPVPNGWMHDYWIALLGSVLAQGLPVDEILIDYRRHDSQVCGWRKKTFKESVKDSLRADPQESWAKLEGFRHARSRVLTAVGWPEPTGERVRLLEDKEAHLLQRAHARSAAGLARVVDVLAELRTGRYHRFSDSWSSVIRDL